MEAYDIFKQFLGIDSAPIAKSTTGDVEADLDAEIKALQQAPAAAKSSPLSSLSTNSKGLVFIAVDDSIDPIKLVLDVSRHVQEKKQSMGRFCQRLTPITHSCHARIEDITKTAELMLKESFTDNQTPTKFAVVYKSRNNSSLHRETVVGAVAGVASCGGRHGVDLTNPVLTIVVEIMTTVCGMCVVPSYTELLKFNLHRLAGLDEVKAAAAAAAAEGDDADVAATVEAPAASKDKEVSTADAEDGGDEKK